MNRGKNGEDEKNMLDFFTQLLQEKDKEIAAYRRDLEELRQKEKNYNAEIENLSYKLNKSVNTTRVNNVSFQNN